MGRFCFWLSFFLGLLGSSILHAQIVGTELMGVGGSGLSAVSPLESPFLNPATLVHVTGVHIGGHYTDGYWASRQHETSWGVGVTDAGSEVMFPGAFRYRQERQTFSNFPAVTGQRMELSTASFIFKQLSWGLSGVRLKQEVEGMKEFTQYDMGVGLLWTPLAELGLSTVYRDFTGSGMDVPERLRLVRKFGFGAQYIFSEFLKVRVDVTRPEELNPSGRWIFQTGTESRVGEFVLVRLGYWNDHWQKEDWFTGGVGFNGPNLKVNYAIAKNREGLGGAIHSIDFRLSF